MNGDTVEELRRNQRVAPHVVPTAYGARLLPQVVDEYARIDPDRIYASILLSANVSQGFRDVTMKDMARAVNSMAWWIKDHLGLRNDFETVGYIGVSDLRYPIIILAAIKCGWKVSLRKCSQNATKPLSADAGITGVTSWTAKFGSTKQISVGARVVYHVTVHRGDGSDSYRVTKREHMLYIYQSPIFR